MFYNLGRGKKELGLLSSPGQGGKTWTVTPDSLVDRLSAIAHSYVRARGDYSRKAYPCRIIGAGQLVSSA